MSEAISAVHNSLPLDNSTWRHWKSATKLLRVQYALPESADSVILASFNRHLKIDSLTWSAWMAVMLATPRTVLWVYCPTAAAQENLRQSAASYGIRSRRIIFMTKAAKVNYSLKNYPRNAY